MNLWKDTQMELTLNSAASKLHQRLRQTNYRKMKTPMKLSSKMVLANQRELKLRVV